MMFDTSAHNDALRRIATDTTHRKMAGINTIPKLDKCVACGKRKTAASGKYKRAGFFCHECK